MECHMTGIARYCPEMHGPQFSWCSRKLAWEIFKKLPGTVSLSSSRMSSKTLTILHHASIWEYPSHHRSWRMYSAPVSLENGPPSLSPDQSNDKGEAVSQESAETILLKPLDSSELKSLLADSERATLLRKLSEANQQNRHLRRQLKISEDALVNFKSELAVMEYEIQAVVNLAEEVAKAGIPQGSRKINGRYIQSHLLKRLEVIHGRLKEQIKDVIAVQSKEVSLFWYGMAENVQVMGNFDGWSQGEQLSPEYTGSFTQFSTTLKLRPGRYEIKFLVDGEWHLSPEFPTTGEGLMENNLLVVE